MSHGGVDAAHIPDEDTPVRRDRAKNIRVVRGPFDVGDGVREIARLEGEEVPRATAVRVAAKNERKMRGGTMNNQDLSL